MKAHRASWVMHKGPIPDGLFVLHRCDNPCCVRPSHLFLGTQLDNIRDMEAKGRANRFFKYPQPKGEKHYRAKLSDADVEDIRKRYSTGNVMQLELAKEFHVDPSNISYIVRRKSRA